MNRSSNCTQECEVLIVGGGPAGSACAWALTQAGMDVIVLDKERFPRDKVCAGWITPQIIQVLNLNLERYAESRVLQPISGFRTGVIGRRTLQTDFHSIVSYGIRRCEFDEFLLQRSQARLMLGTSLKRWQREQNYFVVNDQIRASMLVSCAGHFCPIARQINTRQPKQQAHVVVAQEAEFPITPQLESKCHVLAEIPELYFCPDLKGYGWCIRKGNYLNIGLGRECEQSLSIQVQQFIDFLNRSKRVSLQFPLTFKGHAYRLSKGEIYKLVDDNLLICGDAAGLAYPQSGEGIRPAIESGLLAAWTIINARGNYTAENLNRYQTEIMKRFGHQSSGFMIPDVIQQWFGRLLLSHSHWFSKRVLLQNWFLHSQTAMLKNPFQS